MIKGKEKKQIIFFNTAVVVFVVYNLTSDKKIDTEIYRGIDVFRVCGRILVGRILE